MNKTDDPFADEPLFEEEAKPLIVEGDDWTEDPGERDWLIPEWLPAGRVSMLTGPGKVGKSRLALQLAAAIAAGKKDWLRGGGPELDLKSNQGEVAVLATWEDERDEVARRLHAMKAHEGVDLHKAVGNRLRYIAPRQPLWIPVGRGNARGELSKEGGEVREHCEQRGARLLVVDPRAAAYGLNENDRALVRMFVSDWDRWARETRCAVLLIVHPPKSDGPYSGTTDWHAAARAVWQLAIKTVDPGDKNRRKTDGVRTAVRFACLDTNYGQTPRSLWLKGYPEWEVADSSEAAADFMGKRDGAGAAESPSTADNLSR